MITTSNERLYLSSQRFLSCFFGKLDYTGIAVPSHGQMRNYMRIFHVLRRVGFKPLAVPPTILMLATKNFRLLFSPLPPYFCVFYTILLCILTLCDYVNLSLATFSARGNFRISFQQNIQYVSVQCAQTDVFIIITYSVFNLQRTRASCAQYYDCFK